MRRLALLLLLAVPLWGTGRPPELQQGPPGPAGKNGRDGRDGSVPELAAGIGTDIRVFDGEYLSGHLAVQHDFLRPSDSVFALLGIKLGKSYEQREIERLEGILAGYMARQDLVHDKQKPERGVIRAKD